MKVALKCQVTIPLCSSLENCEEEAKRIGNDSDANGELEMKFDRLALLYYGETEQNRTERLREFRKRLNFNTNLN